jgi:hypothetical protein
MIMSRFNTRHHRCKARHADSKDEKGDIIEAFGGLDMRRYGKFHFFLMFKDFHQ